uniref:Uncharacterized protein n=1 Tax=Romanomermis culicivorax TaxID=13658 RepID=A0A915KLG7_ROMCU
MTAMVMKTAVVAGTAMVSTSTGLRLWRKKSYLGGYLFEIGSNGRPRLPGKQFGQQQPSLDEFGRPAAIPRKRLPVVRKTEVTDNPSASH